jgi:hypothetical protein
LAIDFVIAWVDGNDPTWQDAKNKYIANTVGDNRVNRFRDWDNLQYWFRGVERFAPWFNRIYFITWGHLPYWLNTEHPKLQIVNHKDYIHPIYLPTFNSHTIELNLHRIEQLSNQFVYFNDDTFIIKDMKLSDFFIKGLPCDSAIIIPYISSFRNSIGGIVSNNMEIINTVFDKNKVIRANIFKWINLKYKKHLISTFLSMSYKHFTGFLNPHLPNSYLKDTFNEVWDSEYEVLHQTCLRKIRDKRDVNQWLIRYWQLVTGKFVPRQVPIGRYYSLKNNNIKIASAICNQEYKMVCINDDNKEPIINFEKEKMLLNTAFEKILPEKSSFEL